MMKQKKQKRGERGIQTRAIITGAKEQKGRPATTYPSNNNKSYHPESRKSGNDKNYL